MKDEVFKPVKPNFFVVLSSASEWGSLQMLTQGGAGVRAVSSSHRKRAGLLDRAAHSNHSQHKERKHKETYSHQGISYPT